MIRDGHTLEKQLWAKMAAKYISKLYLNLSGQK
uniref:Four helix bundle protein n=1 Tax=Elaeophora elaphi TaxID=1147741 RepID=A0A0R3RT73_9BILA